MEKFATGIAGFDEISVGGLPRLRTTLIAGSAGSGKTLFMLTALTRGVAEQGLPAVFISFEERIDDIIENAAASGLDLEPLIDNGTLHIEFIGPPTEAVAEVGRYSLDGLLMRIELALGRNKAKFIAIDTIETLFTTFADTRTVRQELVRLFGWLKDRGVTTLISGEQGDGKFTRHGLEEYISDCVVLLDQRTIADVTTRRLRIAKYRGSAHGNNEYPFMIDTSGITVMPLTGARLTHKSMENHVTTGLERLDDALNGGYRRGSTVLISGSSGTGKSILAATFIAAVCREGERAVLLNFEESPDEIFANMKSVGIDLRSAHESGQLLLQSARPTLLGLEQHLVEVYRLVEEFKPQAIVVDPLSSLKAAGAPEEVHRASIRLIDHLKGKGITAVYTAEALQGASRSGVGVSSIIDTWLLTEWLRTEGEYYRRISVIKKRGTKHEKDYMRFEIGSDGISFESEINGR